MNSDYKTFFSDSAKFIALFVIFYLPLLYGIHFKLRHGEAAYMYQDLVNYQIQKIDNMTTENLIFLGDSSLGNAINSSLVSECTEYKALNLALTGYFGYAGAYNFLRRAYKKNHEMKKVILFFTPEIMTYPTAYLGYMFTLEDLTQVFELEDWWTAVKEYGSYIMSWEAFKVLIPRKKSERLENDYMQQGTPIDVEARSDQTGFNNAFVSKDLIFLEKIDSFCQEKNLDCIYIYGPLWDLVASQSSEYYKKMDEALSLFHFKIINTPTQILSRDIGDCRDHVKPSAKDEYTMKYIKSLELHQRYSG